MNKQGGEPSGADLPAILNAIDAAGFAFVDLRSANLSLRVSKAGSKGTPGRRATSAVAPVPAPSVSSSGYRTGDGNATVAAPTWVDVFAPSVGVLSRTPDPMGSPLVEPGERVHVGQVVAQVDAMGDRRPIVLQTAGTVVAVFVETGEFVEYGQTILRIQTGT